jgi:hypothetical protein
MSNSRKKPKEINFSLRERIVPGSMIGLIPYVAEAMAHVNALADFHEKSYVFTEKLETPNYHDISWADPIDFASTQIQAPNSQLEPLGIRPLDVIPESSISKIYDQILARETANAPMTPTFNDRMEQNNVRPDIQEFNIQIDDPDPRPPIDPDPPPIENNIPPEAVLNVESLVGQKTPVLFDATGSYDLDGKITSYHFNFGDGFSYTETPDNSPDGVFDGKTYYTYSNPGQVQTSVTVTDDKGATDTAYKDVTVANAPPVFLNPGDTNPTLAGIENSLLGDSSHTSDNSATPYIEGRLDAVKNTIDNLATVGINENTLTTSNIVQHNTDWTAIANAYDPD